MSLARPSHRALDLISTYTGYSLDPPIEPFTYSKLNQRKPQYTSLPTVLDRKLALLDEEPTILIEDLFAHLVDARVCQLLVDSLLLRIEFVSL